MGNLYIKARTFIYKVSNVLWKKFASKTKYARHIGVMIGDNCLIDTYGWPAEPYLITIGNNVQVTGGAHFYTHGGGHVVREKHPDFDIFGKIVVKDWAYIGAHSHIMPGVTIGEGALVAAGSVVTKSVAPHTVVGGNPARFLCTTDEYFERNKQYDLHTKRKNLFEKKNILLTSTDDLFISK